LAKKQFTLIILSFVLYLILSVLGFAIVRSFFKSNLINEQIVIYSFSIFVVYSAIIRFTQSEVRDLMFYLIPLILAMLVFMILIFGPSTIDRSRSFYNLAWISKMNSCGIYNLAEMKNTLDKNRDTIDYSEQSFIQRMTEHEIRGLLEIDKDNNVRLTGAGKILLNITNLAAGYFTLENFDNQEKDLRITICMK
jgi:FlaA1/EpsC-like NDP-sugar epimerase